MFLCGTNQASISHSVVVFWTLTLHVVKWPNGSGVDIHGSNRSPTFFTFCLEKVRKRKSSEKVEQK